MGLILDSSVAIAAERRGQSVERLIEQVVSVAGNQEAAFSSVGLAELAHGIYRATSDPIRLRRRAFIEDLRAFLPVYPFTAETAMIVGRIDGEQTALGVIIPYVDLMIGATALSLGFSLMTTNVRHFAKIPGLQVLTI